MKITKKIPLYLIVTVMLIGFSSVSTLAQQNSNTTMQVDDFVCRAADNQAFKSCISKVKSKEAQIITVTKEIVCKSREDCEFTFEGITNLQIFGLDRSRTGFKRINSFDYNIFTIDNSTNIKIGDLFFKDDESNFCSGEQCRGVMLIKNSDNLQITSLFLSNVAGVGIELQNTKQALIKGSKIVRSNAQSIVVNNSQNIVIEKNQISDAASNAIIFSATSSGSGSSAILNNELIRNHKDAVYAPCESPCAGGQIRINDGTSNLQITGNTIKDGKIEKYDGLGLYVSGIDINGSGSSNINISCNNISNNRGNGIVGKGFEKVSLRGNTIYGNGLNLNFTNKKQTEDSKENCN
jgi:hypothetical protein